MNDQQGLYRSIFAYNFQKLQRTLLSLKSMLLKLESYSDTTVSAGERRKLLNSI